MGISRPESWPEYSPGGTAHQKLTKTLFPVAAIQNHHVFSPVLLSDTLRRADPGNRAILSWEGSYYYSEAYTKQRR